MTRKITPDSNSKKYTDVAGAKYRTCPTFCVPRFPSDVGPMDSDRPPFFWGIGPDYGARHSPTSRAAHESPFAAKQVAAELQLRVGV